MAVVRSHPSDYWHLSPPTIVVHAQRENKRPVGFAPWPEETVAEENVTPATPKKRKKAKKA